METETAITSQPDIQTDKPWLWKKGQSGNPSGRPLKNHALIESLEQAIESVGRDKLAEKAVNMAMNGDAQMMKYIIDRVAGPPAQTLIHKVEEAAQRIAEQTGMPIEEVLVEAKQLAQGT